VCKKWSWENGTTGLACLAIGDCFESKQDQDATLMRDYKSDFAPDLG